MLTNYLADIEQLLCEQRWDAALREARFMSPQCATRSISMLPGGGSFQSAKVRTATRRRISGVTRRGFLVRVALRGARSNRSIVAALIVSTLARMASSSVKWPCRSSAGTRIRSSGFSRFPQTRSDASHSTISACFAASS